MRAINVGYWELGKPIVFNYEGTTRPGLCSRRKAIAHAKRDYKEYRMSEIIALEDGTWLVWTGTALKKYANKEALFVALALQGVTDFSELNDWSWEDDTAS